MIAVLVSPGSIQPGARLALDDEEAHHLRVRRAAEGSIIRLLDGQGGVGMARLELARGAASAVVTEAGRSEPLAPLRLLVAAGDRDRFGWLAEKSAEVGVSELVPVETARTAGVASRVRPAHLERLQRRAREAIKQSGAAWAPVVGPLVGLEAAASLGAGEPRWLADASGDPPGDGPPPGTVMVGPEGGLTSEESALLRRAGFRPVCLGPHVMRFETAALAAAILARAMRGGSRHE